VDACFLDAADRTRMTYINVLIDMFAAEQSSQRKATELSFLLYRGLRTVLKTDASAPPEPATGASGCWLAGLLMFIHCRCLVCSSITIQYLM
jgi:hypothetical protein